MLTGKPRGNILLTRPRRRWEDIRRDLKENNETYKESSINYVTR